MIKLSSEEIANLYGIRKGSGKSCSESIARNNKKNFNLDMLILGFYGFLGLVSAISLILIFVYFMK